jgi:hypothetical protein
VGLSLAIYVESSGLVARLHDLIRFDDTIKGHEVSVVHGHGHGTL